VTMVSLGEPNI